MSHTPASETQVNTYTIGDQSSPLVAALADGGWVVTWTSTGQDTGAGGIFQQAYNADGTTRGGEAQVNASSVFNQTSPQITALADGGWVVTWLSDLQDGDGWGVYQQAYNANGTTLGAETQVSTTSANDQTLQQITALADGGWVVTWPSYGSDGSARGVYQQAYNASGLPWGDEIQVNTETAHNQSSPQITALSDGGWVVTWQSDEQDGSEYGIYQQAYDADGTPRGDETRVNTETDGNQMSPQVTALADGGWVVTWDSYDQDIWGNIYQQAYDAEGNQLGAETLVNTFTFGEQSARQVTALADGGWVVTWRSFGNDGNLYGVFQQVYDADGSSRGNEIQVNAYTIEDQKSPQTTALADGGWVVTWESYDQDGSSYGVYQQAYNADGTVRGGETRVNTYTADWQRSPTISALADGGWVVTWHSNSQDGAGIGIYQQRFDATGQIYGTNHAPTASDATRTVTEDTTYTFTIADFGFSDGSDGDSLSAVIISSVPLWGALTLDGVTVHAGDAIDPSDIAAGKLVYRPSMDANGEGIASLTFKVVDDGGTAGGGFDTSSTHTVTFDVASVNDAPTASDNTVSMFEDVAYTFALSTFGFSDYEVENDAFSAVIINTLPNAGTLTLNGEAVEAGDRIDADDIATGRLVYMPPADAYGDGLASLTFQVVDDGGTENGGVDTSGTYTITFDVVGVPAVENQVNTYTAGEQFDARVTALTGGGWVVTWTSSGQDGNDNGVYLQAYNADGTKLGGESRVNTYTDNVQAGQKIAALSDGGWVVTWTSEGQDGSVSGVYQQAYNADGSAQGGETLVNTYIPFWQSSQQVTALSDGGWVVTWSSISQDGSNAGIYQQAYNADGSTRGGETRVNTETAGDQYEPEIVSLASGGWVVIWNSYGQDGSYIGVYQQAYNADGSTLGGEVQINTYTDDYQWQPQVAALADGGWVVTWQSNLQDGSGFGVYQQAYRADGTANGNETRVSTATFGQQMEQQVTALADGGWVVAWSSEYQDGNGYGVYQQAYKADGTVLGDETQVNLYTQDNQGSPQITALANGGWVVAWYSDEQDGSERGVYQQAFNADGTRLGDETRINTYTSSSQWNPQIAALADGGWVVTWSSYGQDGDQGGIYQQRYDAQGQVYGSNHAPTAADSTLTAVEDTAYTFSTAAFGFSDAIDGDSLSAVIITTVPSSGTLQLSGTTVEAGDMIEASDIAAGKLIYLPAADANGDDLANLSFKVVDDAGTEGGGFDTSGTYTISFNVTAVNDAPVLTFDSASTLESRAVRMNVLAGATDIDGDTLQITEASISSGFGSVSISSQKLVFDPTTAPNQNIDEGESRTVTVSYTVSDGHGGLTTQTIDVEVNGVSPDIIRGTSASETLTGSDGTDFIYGFNGLDVLNGGLGADTLRGGNGADRLHGRSDDDLLDGGLGADRLIGGGGTDLFLFRDVADSTTRASGRDLVLDFSRRQHDQIDLHLIDAKEAMNGNQSFKFIGTEPFSGKAGELCYDSQHGQSLVKADTDGDLKADFSILIDNLTTLRESDFIL